MLLIFMIERLDGGEPNFVEQEFGVFRCLLLLYERLTYAFRDFGIPEH